MKKSYIFDLDGTLRMGVNGKFVRAGRFENQIPLPGVIEKLQSLTKEGVDIFVVTNQGAPSFGRTSELQIWRSIIYFTDVILGGIVKDVKLNHYHPDGTVKHRYVDKRKPKPDLLLELEEDYQIKKEDAVFIGNASLDETAASNAGVEFMWAHDFFGWDKENLFFSENESIGWAWNLDRLREEYASDTELLKRLGAFLELSGENYGS